MKTQNWDIDWKKIGFHMLCCFLPCFMILIFGPAEIFFSNVNEFEFVYGEFAGYLACGAVIITVVLATIGFSLPDILDKVYLSIILGIAGGGYAQIMFFNRNLDLLGRNSDGYNVGTFDAIKNLIIWLCIIVFLLVIVFWKKQLWKKILLVLSMFLLIIQVVAYISLLVTAKGEAYRRNDAEYHLTGKNEFTVSANENVIVFVLDMFSNEYIDSLESAYPGSIDFLHDFTYYNNDDCTYFGTFPSLAHMLSGCEVDMQQSVNDWCIDIWNGDNYVTFKDMLESKNYVSNLYTSSLHVLIGNNDTSLLDGKFENITNKSENIDIFYKLLFKTMCKMSAYRMAPEILKNCFYTEYGEYTNIVLNTENKVYHENYEFYEQLCANGLSADKKHNYYNIYHLMGTHSATTDEFGHYKENVTMEETAKGCMVLVNEYLNELRQLGVYDNSTIIITADHGTPKSPQVIFFIKEKNEHHDKLVVNESPISHREFFPTVAYAVQGECTQWGECIQKSNFEKTRSRDYFQCMEDSDYPVVPYYTQDKDGNANVYYRWTYVGDGNELSRLVHDEEPDEVIPIVDSVY